MTALAVVPDGAVPDQSWTASDLFDWLDAAVPAVVAIERKADDARVHVGYVLWVLRQKTRNDDEYTRHVAALAETHEVSVRTLHRWREQAELVHELAPSARSAAQRSRRQPDSGGPAEELVKVEVVTPQPLRLFDPDNLDELREISTAVMKVGASRWAEALTVTEVDSVISVMRAARTALLEARATGADHVHRWKNQKSATLGVIYVCEVEGCTARTTKKD